MLQPSRFFALALAFQAGFVAPAVAALKPDIRADTNRDGVVDVEGDSDVAGKAFWTAQRGAIYLPNVGDKHRRCPNTDLNDVPLSNDELAYCSDGSGHLLLAPEYVAPLRTMPMNVSDDATAHVFATPRAAYERVRIFLLENLSEPNTTSSWRHVDQQLFFNATQLRTGLTLGIDGREFVKDASVWDGTVTVRFEVTDGTEIARDEVALKVAPVLTHHHLQRVETIVSTAANESNPIQQYFVSQLDDARDIVGVEDPLLLFNQSSDIWAQDILEPAYASMPGPRGPIAIRIMMRSAQSTRTGGRQIFEQLRGPGVGGFQPGSSTGTGFGYNTIDSYGNVETIPPHRSKRGVLYKAGRVIFGKHWDMMTSQPVRDLLYGQGVQSPLVLETGWLVVGHVDEFVQFLPYDNELGFTIGIADTRSALEILEKAKTDGHGDAPVISFDESQVESFGYEYPIENLNMTILDALENTTFIESNAYAQKHIDANLDILLSEVPLDREDVIRVPVLYHDVSGAPPFVRPDGLAVYWAPVTKDERQLVSFTPGAVNGIVIGHQYLSPKQWGPVVNGVDVFAEKVVAAYAKAGMNVTFIDDYLSHHLSSGEVHCGSNTLRQTDIAWWE
ncbi:hypothetical protein B0T10DRAFT_588293 [Thelonectria olida]|uniref:Protein-arginine deiminase C-terminal domain-containing protein n=1 Tax=Thelonectria olida TaxID=1576542 RepID=A0A9P8VU70_9HYPO|nr:hypothetical protein B0T10DRAFT_588293 [Thelonectria olida]